GMVRKSLTRSNCGTKCLQPCSMSSSTQLLVRSVQRACGKSAHTLPVAALAQQRSGSRPRVHGAGPLHLRKVSRSSGATACLSMRTTLYSAPQVCFCFPQVTPLGTATLVLLPVLQGTHKCPQHLLSIQRRFAGSLQPPN